MRTLSDVSICMPYWHRQRELDRALDAYWSLYGDALEISVCADGCEVEAPGCIVTHLPPKDRPLNPCVPINAAVRASTRPIVVITNPEVFHVEHVITQLLSDLASENTYVTARCVDTDGTLLAGAEVDYSTAGRLPVPPGAHFHFCAMLHRSLFDRAGGFDEDYRHVQGCDDNDWLWRLNRAGAQFVESRATVHHSRTHTRWNLPHGRAMFLSKWPECASLQRTG